MLELLVAFTMYRLEAHWGWWVLYVIMFIRGLHEKNRTK